MSKYYLNGYTPPKDVTNSEKVKEYQRKLGVTVDGIWGPKTQAAYDRANANSSAGSSSITNTSSNTNSSTNASSNTNASSSLGKTPSSVNTNTFLNYYDSILSAMTIPSIKVDVPSEKELASDISSFLRPAYDAAITKRKKTEKSNLAEIDVDAVSRGMGSSTFVSSLKSRERIKTSEDISDYETDYASALSKNVYNALSAYKELALEAEKFNAQAKQNASDTAFSAAQAIYKAFLEAEAEAAKLSALNSSSSNSSSSSSSGSSSKASSSASSSKASSSGSKKQNTSDDKKTSSKPILSYADCILYLSNLSQGQLKYLATSTTEYWKDIRGQLMDVLGEDNYQRLLGTNGQFYYDRR